MVRRLRTSGVMRQWGRRAAVGLVRSAARPIAGRVATMAAGLVVATVLLALMLQLSEVMEGNDVSFSKALWSVIFTLFGAADYATVLPESTIGQAVMFVVSLLCLGVFGYLLAEVMGNFVLKKLREVLGMANCKLSDHYVVCGWNSRARVLAAELEARRLPFVVVADLQDNPLNESLSRGEFVRGDCSEDAVLRRAGIQRAKVAIVLSDDAKPPKDADARSILTALAIEDIGHERPGHDVYTMVELRDERSRTQAQHAHVDEVILVEAIGSSLLASCAVNRGLSGLLEDLFSARGSGSCLQVKACPASLIGRSFGEALTLFSQGDGILLGVVEKGEPTAGTAAPWRALSIQRKEERIPEGARLVVIVPDDTAGELR